MRRLQHVADAGVQPQHRALAVILAVDEDAALSGLKEAAGKVDERAFARARFADNGDRGTGGNIERKVF